MDYLKYQRILNDIIKKAPIEAGVQTLVYMLLDDIISKKYEKKISVLVADLRKGKNPIFGGDGGIVDLCVVNDDFMFPNKLNEEQERKRKGCVEVKATNIELPADGEIFQIVGHIRTYKKVIYTNGLVWQYYAPSKKYLEKSNKIFITYKEYRGELVEKKNQLREKCHFSKKKYITAKFVDESIEKDNFTEDVKEILGNIKKSYERSESLETWLTKMPNEQKWELKIAKDEKGKFINNTTNTDEVYVDEESFESLIYMLKNVDWESETTEG